MAHLHLVQPLHGTIARLQRIKQWHVAHKTDHPLEYQLWDVMLTVWVMGWIAWLPAYALDMPWAYPFCVAFVSTPGFYIRLRVGAHRAHQLRCDWADLAAPPHSGTAKTAIFEDENRLQPNKDGRDQL